MIKLTHLSFAYDATDILRDLNLTFAKHKITFLIGANGSGKTTLAHLLSGLIFPTSGEIYLDDLHLTRQTANSLVRQKIGLVFQDPRNQILFPKVSDDLRFTLENLHVPPADIADRIRTSLQKTDMTAYLDANPYHLSGGQQQRVAIASQLSLQPDYLVLDEATSMLDLGGKRAIYRLLRRLRRDIGLIFISNDLSELIYADDVVILDQHQASKYPLRDILRSPDILETHHLEIPFILQLARQLHITDPADLSESHILQKVAAL